MIARLAPVLITSALLSAPTYAGDVIIEPGRDVTVNVQEPHLLTPLAAAKRVLACCPAKVALAQKLTECAEEKRVLAEEADDGWPGWTWAALGVAAGIALGVVVK